jgi:apolipoprotein N-acyltransferase
VILYGQARLRQYDPAAQGAEEIKVAVVQGSIHREYRWKSIYYGKNLSQYIRMSRCPEALEAELVVWPENAVNFHPDRETLFLKLMTNSLKTPPRTLLTGAPHMVQSDQGDKRFYNAAFKITAQGIEKLYKKIHLMPFSERKPAWVARALASPGEAPSKFSPGEEHTLFTLNGNRFASPICFEMVYPELIRRFVENGAQFLVNISNDSWFGPTAGPWQHLSFSPLRAVENRRYIVRAANTGISAFITPTGKILDATELDKPAHILGTVTPLDEMTFYTKNGDVFATACALATLISVLVCLRSRRRA